jgi:hypothetical protein
MVSRKTLFCFDEVPNETGGREIGKTAQVNAATEETCSTEPPTPKWVCPVQSVTLVKSTGF